jgi:hypothetical protein
LRGRAQVLTFLGLLALLGGRFAVFPSPAAAVAGTYVVDSTGDQGDANAGNGVCSTSAGTCTLRAALTEASRDHIPSTVNFAIPGDGTHTIGLTGSLPNLDDLGGGTTIDGYTQPGATPNTAASGSNAVLKIEIRGTGPGGEEALNLTAGGNVVRGLAIYDVRIGIQMRGDFSVDNVVVGNFVGTDASATFGATVRDSNTNSVIVRDRAARNIIGRPALADRNVISGGFANGIVIGAIAAPANTDGNIVQNNVIGLKPNGDPLPNLGHGIDVNLGGAHSFIGGLEPGMGNVISANSGSGVEVSHGDYTVGNQVVGNRIGTDLSGTGGPPGVRNGQANVHVEDQATDTLIAYNTIGTTPRVLNDGGIKVDHSFGTKIEHNRIGISEDGSPISNGPYGVQVETGSTGTIVGPGNVIAHNLNGVRIQDDATQGTTVTENQIYANDGLGIDISAAGIGLGTVNPNDPGDGDGGPNGRLNFPVFTEGNPTSVKGTACAGCRVEIFEADSTDTAPELTTSYGEGKAFLAAGTAGGDGVFVVTLPSSAFDRTLTATATDGAGNTSEFARNFLVRSTYDRVTDHFTRTTTDGWGEAEVGGAYTPKGNDSSFSVNGTEGVIEVPEGRTREIDLLGVSTAVADLRMTVRTDRLPWMGSHEVGFVVRRVDESTMYVARLRYSPFGMLRVGIERSGVPLGEVVLSSAPPVGTPINLRASVTGTSPTRISIKAWVKGEPEPAAWALRLNDSAPELQRPGAVGVIAASTEMFGVQPVIVHVDDLTATPTSPK